MYYLEYNNEGEIIGFYSDQIHTNIPINSISVSSEEWQDCLNNQGLRKVNVKTKTLFKSTLKEFVPNLNTFPTLINPKKTALDKLASATTIVQLKTILTEYFKS